MVATTRQNASPLGTVSLVSRGFILSKYGSSQFHFGRVGQHSGLTILFYIFSGICFVD